jgi:hypothetical protein
MEQDRVDVENGVVKGGSGELYLGGGAHGMLEFARGQAVVAAPLIVALRSNLERRARIAGEFGLPFLHLIAPEKYKVYREDFPIQGAIAPVDYYRRAGVSGFLYPDEELRQETRGRTYYKTDTHWAPHGAARVVSMIAAAFGRSAADLKLIEQEMLAAMTPRSFLGDLGSKIKPPVEEHSLRARGSSLYRTVDNGLGNDPAHNVNDARLILGISDFPTAQGRLIIFGSSYMLTSMPFLAMAFKRVIFCRTRFFHPEMVYMCKPDFILTEMAERYLTNTPNDEGAPPFLIMPRLLNRTPSWPEDGLRDMVRELSGEREINWALFGR